MATEITAAGTAVEFQEFKIDVPLSPVGLAPSAVVELPADGITANDPVTITIDGDVAFDGSCQKVEINDDGLRQAKCRHPGVDLMEETVSFSFSGTDLGVLEAALAASDRGGSFALTFTAGTTSLANEYSAEDKPLKRVFRDMMDRSRTVWWINPGKREIIVDTLGGRGQWQAIDVGSDAATLKKFDRGSVDSVRNSVTVVGTGKTEVRANLRDQQSIDEYGVQSADKPFNYDYITDESEAASMADRLIIPDPLPTGKVAVGRQAGDIVQPLANYTVDLTDASKGIDATDLVVEKQTIRQGRATLTLGAGAGVNFEDVNRTRKSGDENAQPGSVYDSDRIADDAVNQLKLADGSVLEDKLADAAVATAKLQNNAVINGKLDDLSVSETKIQDDSISTPKLVAEAVTANEIEADTITAAEIAAGTITALEIAADTITADQVAADTLTANEVDTLDLDAGEFSITSPDGAVNFEFLDTVDYFSIYPLGSDQFNLGGSEGSWSEAWVDEVVRPTLDDNGSVGLATVAYSEMHAHNFVTASPDPIDGVDCDGVCDIDWYDNPPEAVRQRARDIGESDAEVPEDRDHTPVELGTMANWLLETCKAQQERINDLERRLSKLEQQ